MDLATPGWELYRSFLAVLDEGSLSAAARVLGLTQPTVGNHIQALEAALAVPLFTRSPRGLIPTETALSLRPHAETMAAAADALRRAASGEADELRGTVRITASEIVAAEVLPPILADFQHEHRQVTIELLPSNRNADLLRHEADIAVRMLRPAQQALIARHIGEAVLGLYAHRRYLERRGTPATLAEVMQHTLIGPDRDAQSTRGITGLEILSAAHFSVRVDSHLVQLAAVRGGQGIGLIQHGIARRDPDLVPILPDRFAAPLPIWVVMHEDLRASRRVRLLFDHLVSGLGIYVREQDLFSRRPHPLGPAA